MFKNILKTVQQEKSKSQISQQEVVQYDQIPQQPPQQLPQIQFLRPTVSYLTFKVNTVNSIYYIPNHITNEQSEYLLDQIYEQNDRWNELKYSKRRVQLYGGEVTINGLTKQEPLLPFLQQLSQLAYLDKNEITINHVLINEYQKAVGIPSHTDGPLYYGFVNIISLGSPCIFIFTKNNEKLKLLIEPLSLLIFADDAYTNWLHGIDYFKEDIVLIQVQDNKVNASDVVNFNETGLSQQIKQCDTDIIEFITSLPNCDIEQVTNNNQYNYAIIFKRNVRISITLRHVPVFCKDSIQE